MSISSRAPCARRCIDALDLLALDLLAQGAKARRLLAEFAQQSRHQRGGMRFQCRGIVVERAQGRGFGQRRTLNAFNQKPGANGVALYTPSWGAATPAQPGAVSAVPPRAGSGAAGSSMSTSGSTTNGVAPAAST